MPFQPRDAFSSPRLAQPATFMRLPYASDAAGLDVAILGVPVRSGSDHVSAGREFAVRDVVGDRQRKGVNMASEERTVWYFYTVRWGHQDEFLELFRKNHYPVLKAQLGERFSSVRTYEPRYHGDGRADWTFAVAITYPNAAVMASPSKETDIARAMFPDQERFRKDEQRRFELLDAHWDVPLKEIDM